MAFTIQHPTNGLFWNVADDGRIILDSTGSVYSLDTVHGTRENSHLLNSATGNCVYAIGVNGGIEERGHFGALTLFEWTIDDDGSIHNDYLPVFIGEDLKTGSAPFQWKIVPVTRASALVAEALKAPEPEPEPESEEDEVPDITSSTITSSLKA